MAGSVTIEQRGRVLLATVQNPPHGLLDPGMVEGLERLLARADEDAGVGAVVLTGGHESRFIAHADVEWLLRGAEDSPSLSRPAARAALRAGAGLRRIPGADGLLSRTPAAGMVELERFHAVLLGMQRCDAVWIAALNGSAMGGGCEVALACDFRFMADGDFRLGQPEILFGFPPGGGGTQRLARMLGPTRALRLVLDGGALTPREAAELGLIDRIVEPAGLLDAAMAEAAYLGSRAKAAIGACKRTVYEGGSLPLADGLRLERAEFLSALGTPEAIEAMRAYVEATERTGDLPGYDADALRSAFERGRFA